MDYNFISKHLFHISIELCSSLECEIHIKTQRIISLIINLLFEKKILFNGTVVTFVFLTNTAIKEEHNLRISYCKVKSLTNYEF